VVGNFISLGFAGQRSRRIQYWAWPWRGPLNLMQRSDRPPDGDLKDVAPRSVLIEGRLHTARGLT
jgi:hypothetical protein